MDMMTGKEVPLIDMPRADFFIKPVASGSQQGVPFVAGFAYPARGQGGYPRVAVRLGSKLYGIELEVLIGTAIAAKEAQS